MSYDKIIPIGSNCRIAEALNDSNLRKESLPLDWVLCSVRSVYEAFSDEFKSFFNDTDCIVTDTKGYEYVLNTKYHINITHENKINNEIVEKYVRRINRLFDSLKGGGKILLIRNLMDCTLQDFVHDTYRKDEEKLGHSDTDLTWLVKLKHLLVERYPESDIDLMVIHYNDLDTEKFKDELIFERTTINLNVQAGDKQSCVNVVRNIKLK
jgi:hypothetical protein